MFTLWTALLLAVPVLSPEGEPPDPADLEPPPSLLDEREPTPPIPTAPPAPDAEGERESAGPTHVVEEPAPVPPAPSPAPRSTVRDEAFEEEDLADESGGLGPIGGAVAGYAAGAVVPALGVGAGLGAFGVSLVLAVQQNDRCLSPILLFLGGVVAGATVGASAVACGPCTSLGATIGAATGSLGGEEASWQPVLAALPGVALGALAAGLLVGGPLLGSFLQSIPVLGAVGGFVSLGGVIVGVPLALLAGPASIAGVVLSELAQEDEGELPYDDEGARVPGAFHAPLSNPRALAIAY